MASPHPEPRKLVPVTSRLGYIINMQGQKGIKFVSNVQKEVSNGNSEGRPTNA